MFVHKHVPSDSHRFLRFGSFEIDADARVLRKHGAKIRLQEQPFEVLLTLLEARGQIVTREQLRQRLWPQGTFVEFDHALNTAVKKIRATLCDDAALPRYIETIPRRGYRFLAPLEISDSTGSQFKVGSAVVGISSPARRQSFRTTMIALALGVPVLLLSAWVISRPSVPASVSLAVLPFINLNLDTGHAPAVVVFPQLLLQDLRRTHPARLVIRNSLRAPGQGASPAQTQLSQIEYVVEGGVLIGEQHLHIAVQLVRLRDQNCVWARDFDRNSDDAETEMEIAEEVVRQMQPTLAMLSSEPR